MAAPWFKKFAGDYLSDSKVRLLTYEQRGILETLWCFAWKDGGIPVDPAQQGMLLGLTAKAMRTHSDWIRRFFQPDPNDSTRLVSPRMELERIESEAKGAKARESALNRWSKRNANALPEPMRTHSEGTSERNATRDANPMLSVSVSESVSKTTTPLAPQGAPAAPEAEKPKRKKRTRDPLPLNRLGGTALEAFEEARACWPLEIHGWNERIRGNETRKIALGNIPQAQKFFLQLIEEGHATAQELYACAWVAVEEWKREGYLWIPHLSTFYGPEKETWAQFLPKAKQALQTFQEVG